VNKIILHYTEATHNQKGELVSLTYNQMTLDRVILDILIEVQEYTPKTRKEYGHIYRTMFLQQAEMVGLLDAKAQVEAEMFAAMKKKVEQHEKLLRLQEEIRQAEKDITTIAESNSEQEALMEKLKCELALKQTEVPREVNESCCSLF
jgi:ATP-dependent Lon protease